MLEFNVSLQDNELFYRVFKFKFIWFFGGPDYLICLVFYVENRHTHMCTHTFLKEWLFLVPPASESAGYSTCRVLGLTPKILSQITLALAWGSVSVTSTLGNYDMPWNLRTWVLAGLLLILYTLVHQKLHTLCWMPFTERRFGDMQPTFSCDMNPL